MDEDTERRYGQYSVPSVCLQAIAAYWVYQIYTGVFSQFVIVYIIDQHRRMFWLGEMKHLLDGFHSDLVVVRKKTNKFFKLLVRTRQAI